MNKLGLWPENTLYIVLVLNGTYGRDYRGYGPGRARGPRRGRDWVRLSQGTGETWLPF